MGWSRRGLAVLAVACMLAGTTVPGVLAEPVTTPVAEPTDSEITAMRGFRAHLAAEASAVRDRLTRYREAIADPLWYVVPTPDSGPVAIDLSRLPDHALAATYFAGQPRRWDELTNPVFTWDSPFVTSVGRLLDAAQSGDDLDAVAADLGSSLAQADAEKRALYRPTLKHLRADLDGIEASLASFDEVMVALGVEPAALEPAAPEPASTSIEPLLSPDGEFGALYDFRADLVAWTDETQRRISELEAAIDDPEMVVYDQAWGYEQVVWFDLRELATYETVVEYLSEHPDSQGLLDVYAADGQGLHVAFRTMTAFQIARRSQRQGCGGPGAGATEAEGEAAGRGAAANGPAHRTRCAHARARDHG